VTTPDAITTEARFFLEPGHSRQRQYEALGAYFRDLPRGPQVQAKKDPARPLIIALRKQNLSIYDIQDALSPQGHALSLTAIHEVLRAEVSAPASIGPTPRR